jgi:hypothetical protein
MTATADGNCLYFDFATDPTVSLGLVPPEIVSDLRNERTATGRTEFQSPTYGIQKSTPTRTAEAVAQGDLHDLVETGSGPMPSNVIIEPEARKQPREP